MAYERIMRAVLSSPWAIMPEKFEEIMAFLELQMTGNKMTAEEVEQRIGAAVRANPRASGNVAVLPLYGVISQRMSLMQSFSGGTSTEQFTGAFRQALADPNVKAIVIDVDSPGGSVAGVQELADEIYRARGQKPIVAVANSLMASAAYWIASAADEVVASPGALVGSIGVIYAHTDVSKAAEAQGVKTTFITAGRYKAEANEWEPLADDARAHIQSIVDDVYSAFTGSVARGRGVSVAQARDGMGQGRVVTAKQAVAMKMADRIATLDDTLARFGVNTGSVGARAEDALELVSLDAADAGAAVQTGTSDMELRQRRLRLLAQGA